MPLASLLFHDVIVSRPDESGFNGPIADGYKIGAAAFEAHLQAVARRQLSPRVVRGPADSIGDGITLTFDDGGVSYATEIAPRLEARGWLGHCFVTTQCIGRPGFLSRPQIRDLDRRGHLIGSHSATHPTRFSTCTWDEMIQEWRTSSDILADIVGHDVRVASLPGGYYSSSVGRAAAAAGVRVLFTSEPDVRPRAIEGCALLGRFALRRRSDPERTAALVAADPQTLWVEQGAWRLKRAVKRLTGASYPRICAWLGHLRPAPPLESGD